MPIISELQITSPELGCRAHGASKQGQEKPRPQIANAIANDVGHGNAGRPRRGCAISCRLQLGTENADSIGTLRSAHSARSLFVAGRTRPGDIVTNHRSMPDNKRPGITGSQAHERSSAKQASIFLRVRKAAPNWTHQVVKGSWDQRLHNSSSTSKLPIRGVLALKRHGTAQRRLWQLLTGAGPYSGLFMDDATTPIFAGDCGASGLAHGGLGGSHARVPDVSANSRRSPKDRAIVCWPAILALTIPLFLRGVSRKEAGNGTCPHGVPPPTIASWASPVTGNDFRSAPCSPRPAIGLTRQDD
jgi:hypothetical protein